MQITVKEFLEADLSLLPATQRDANGSLQLTFLRRRARTNPAVTESTLVLDATWESVTVTDSLADRPTRFARLRVETID